MKPDEDFDAPALMALEADRVAHACAARATAGLSPAAVALAFGDWALHLAAAATNAQVMSCMRDAAPTKD